MRRNWLIHVTCGILLASGASAWAIAQQRGAEQGSRTDLDEIRKVSTLLKSDVLNKANEKIASVTDLILLSDGRIDYAILGVGGLAGIGTKYTAVPWSDLNVKHLHGKWAVDLDMTKDALEKAPKLQDDNYKELANPQWVERIHQFFGARGAGVSGSTRETGREGRSPNAHQIVLRASKILDATLKNSRDENLGKVEDLLLDRNWRAAFAIIGHGGVLGIGENYIPIPWSKLRLNYRPEDTKVVAVTDATKDQLEKAPLVKGDSYATMLAPGFTSQVYRYFGMESPR